MTLPLPFGNVQGSSADVSMQELVWTIPFWSRGVRSSMNGLAILKLAVSEKIKRFSKKCSDGLSSILMKLSGFVHSTLKMMSVKYFKYLRSFDCAVRS